MIWVFVVLHACRAVIAKNSSIFWTVHLSKQVIRIRHFGLKLSAGWFSGSFSAFLWLLVSVFLVPILAHMQHYLPACSLGLGLNNRLCRYLLLGWYAIFYFRIQILFFFFFSLLNKIIKACCKLCMPAMTGFPIRSFISHLFTEAVLSLSHIHMV